MLKDKYQIESQWGVITILLEENASRYIGSIITDGVLFECIPEDVPYQLPLPLRLSKEQANFIDQAEDIINRTLQAISFLQIRQEQILRFCLHGGIPAIELLEDCPAIAFLATQKLEKNKNVAHYQQAIDSLICNKRHEILRQCSFPSSKWVVRILKKIPANLCYSEFLSEVEKLLRRNNNLQIKILRHLQTITKPVIEIMNDEVMSVLAQPGFYLVVSQCSEKDYWDLKYMVREIKRLYQCQDENQRKLYSLQSLPDLERIHDLYDQELQPEMDWIMTVVFPEPPIPKRVLPWRGKQFGIFPIISGKELYEESDIMDHCIVSYADEISSGSQLYAYHVSLTEDIEATVLIEKTIDSWSLKEIRGLSNSAVDEKTEYYVHEWVMDWNRKQRSLAKQGSQYLPD